MTARLPGTRVYPRVGGETTTTAGVISPKNGLPPRGRGNLVVLDSKGGNRRSTPAWAGKPRWDPSSDTPETVYPRVGGETMSRSRRNSPGKGLPPRGRGNRAHLVPGGILRQVYPRVGGETAFRARSRILSWGLPPRGRGNHFYGLPDLTLLGSTPAWAGKPRQGGTK